MTGNRYLTSLWLLCLFGQPAIAQYVYWFESQDDTIRRSTLGGQDVEQVLTMPGVDFGTAIAVDWAGGKIYWAGRVPTTPNRSAIQRSNLDGSNIETIVQPAAESLIEDIELDPAGGKIYWVDVWSDTIQRSNLDGSNIEVIATNTSASLVDTHALALVHPPGGGVPAVSVIGLIAMGLLTISAAAFVLSRRRAGSARR